MSKLNVNELMIGDWVIYHKHLPMKIAQLYDGIDLEGLNPIPLTAEILEKNGFKKDKYSYFIYKDYDEEVAVWFRESFMEITHVKYIFNPEDVTEVDFDESLTFEKCYVHNLQHALRDFKLDKEIVL